MRLSRSMFLISRLFWIKEVSCCPVCCSALLAIFCRSVDVHRREHFFSYTLKLSNGESSYLNKPLVFMPLVLCFMNIFLMRLLNEKILKVSGDVSDDMPYDQARMNHFTTVALTALLTC